MTRSRGMFTAQEKAAVVKRYLVDKVPVFDLCDELGLQLTQVHQWQKQLFENADAAFARPGRKSKPDNTKDKKIEALQAKIQLKNEVVAELLQERVQLKRELGGALTGTWTPHDTRDSIVDYTNYWSKRAGTPAKQTVRSFAWRWSGVRMQSALFRMWSFTGVPNR